MEPVSQRNSIDRESLKQRDQARFWCREEQDGLECLTAQFNSHRYTPHSHETYVLGLYTKGVNIITVRGVRYTAAAGDLCFVNPGDIHEGVPGDHGYAYRMIYPSMSLIRQLAGIPRGGTPYFPHPVVRDPAMFRRFLHLHCLLDHGESLACDESMHRVISKLLQQYAAQRPVRNCGCQCPKSIQRARDFLAATLDRQVRLDELAMTANLSPYALLRQFKLNYGVTPHHFHNDRRVHEARRLLRQGNGITEVALATGFCDQSHLNRAFKARIGITPGQYCKGLLSK